MSESLRTEAWRIWELLDKDSDSRGHFCNTLLDLENDYFEDSAWLEVIDHMIDKLDQEAWEKQFAASEAHWREVSESYRYLDYPIERDNEGRY